jgi:hypothetical protein
MDETKPAQLANRNRVECGARLRGCRLGLPVLHTFLCLNFLPSETRADVGLPPCSPIRRDAWLALTPGSAVGHPAVGLGGVDERHEPLND